MSKGLEDTRLLYARVRLARLIADFWNDSGRNGKLKEITDWDEDMTEVAKIVELGKKIDPNFGDYAVYEALNVFEKNNDQGASKSFARQRWFTSLPPKAGQ